MPDAELYTFFGELADYPDAEEALSEIAEDEPEWEAASLVTFGSSDDPAGYHAAIRSAVSAARDQPGMVSACAFSDDDNFGVPMSGWVFRRRLGPTVAA